MRVPYGTATDFSKTTLNGHLVRELSMMRFHTHRNVYQRVFRVRLILSCRGSHWLVVDRLGALGPVRNLTMNCVLMNVIVDGGSVMSGYIVSNRQEATCSPVLWRAVTVPELL